MKKIVAGLISLVILPAIIYLLLPKGPREQIEFDDPFRVRRETLVADEHMVVAGTPWAARAGNEILNRGGNAFDAAAAALLALNVTYGEAASFPSVAPLLIYNASTRTVASYIGAGTAPAAATIEEFRKRGHQVVPLYDTLAQLVPASPDVLISLLTDQGTLSFTEVSRAAIELARDGFPVHQSMVRNFNLSLTERIGFYFLLPYNTDVYLRGEWWRPLHHGDRFIRPDLARTFEAMAAVEQEKLAAGSDRVAALAAVRDYFYRGPLAEAIVKLHEETGGLMTRDDLASYRGGWEDPVAGEFEGFTVFSNSTWSQGIVVPMALQILDAQQLRKLGHNSPDYINRVVQVLELVMADREAYVTDPAHADVPVFDLLSQAYAVERRSSLSARAFGEFPKPGKLPGGIPDYSRKLVATMNAGDWPMPGTFTPTAAIGKDTSYLAVVDRAGNAVSLTPSDFPTSPMVPGTGLTLGVRMTQFRLNPDHPAALLPGKRPRITPHALMLLRGDEFYMSIGTPGGDMQPQASLQVLLNHLVFGMDLQKAVEAPRFRTLNFPDSFAPNVYHPGLIRIEASLADRADELRAMGYKVELIEDLDNSFGAVGVVVRDGGRLSGAADPREATWAEGR